MKSTEEVAFTIENFYRFCQQGRLMGLRCSNGHFSLPPKTRCPSCRSTSLRWAPLSGRGKLLSYTQVHSTSKPFEKYAPYFLGLVKLEEGLRLLGMIRDVEEGSLRAGLKVVASFEGGTVSGWPNWPHIIFRQAE